MGDFRFISYIRVSTVQQGESGLGLEAQRQAVADHLRNVSGELTREYVEIESGKRSDRPQLREAINACEQERAVLIIAKLDRLARNVAFISALMEAKVSFVAADNPHADKLMLHLLAAFAEHERDQIRSRTKAALAAAKARGVVLGRYGREILSKRNRDDAMARARDLSPVVQELRRQGLTTVQVADELNRRNIPSARGCRWHPATAYHVLKRVEKLSRESTEH